MVVLMDQKHFKSKMYEVSEQDAREIMGLENAIDFDDKIMASLIKKGWDKTVFDRIFKLSPKCEHGCPHVFYNERLNSVLVPSPNNSPDIMLQVTSDGDFHFHTLMLLPLPKINYH